MTETQYESHYSVASAELVATADAIRAKTGNASGIVWEKDTGFAGAVESISPVLQEKTATENGEVVPDEGFDGLSKVTVAVENSGGAMAINGIIEQYKVNAGATVSAGDFVEFVNKFKTGMFSSGTVGDVSACKLDNRRVLIAYRDSGNSNFGTAVVLSLGADGVTVGEAVVFNSASTSYFSAVALTDSRVLIAYQDGGNSSYGTAIVLTVDGTTITTGTEKVFNSASTSYFSAVALTDSRVLIAYQDGGNSSYGTAIVLTVDGTTITAGTAKSFNTNQYTYDISALALTDSKAVVVYRSGSGSQMPSAIVLTVNGTTITAGKDEAFGGSYIKYVDAVALTDSKVLAVYTSDDATKHGSAIVLTVDGATITKGTATKFVYNYIPYISAVALTDSKVLVAYQNTSNYRYGTAIVLTVDGTTITVGSAKVFDYNTMTYNSLVAFSETSALVAYNNTTGAFTSLAIDGTTITADGAETGTYVQPTTRPLYNVGVAKTGGSEGETVEVYIAGNYIRDIAAPNATVEPANPTLYRGGTAEITITPDITYAVDAVTVTGCEYTWNKASGVLVLTNPTGKVTITVSTKSTARYTQSATEITSGTELTASVDCAVGDLVVAAIATRDTLTLSDGWTLVSTSGINSADTTNGQRLSWAWKFAESTTEAITVTQASAQRLYINMVALQGATGVTDNGYSYRDDTTGGSMTVDKPEGLVLWGATAPNMSVGSWSMSNNVPIIQLGASDTTRLIIGLDQTDVDSVTIVSKSTATTMIVGSLSVHGMDKFY